MNRNTIGLIACIIFFVVNFTALHTVIPGVEYLKLGFFSSIVLLLLVLPNLFQKEWYYPLGKWRFLFLIAIIPGFFFGFGTGRVRSCFLTSLQDFIGSFIAVSVFVNSVSSLKVIWKTILISSFIISLFVIFNGGHGPGMLDDENDVGLVLVMLLAFSYFALSQTNKNLYKIFILLSTIIILIAIASTASRGAMMGIIPTLFIIWVQSKNKVLSLFAILFLVVLAISFGPPNLINEFESIKNTNEGTASTRRYFWHLSFELFKVRPIFGVGAGCWGNAVWSGIINLPHNVSNSTPHSLYFQLISELGIIGIIPWTMLLFLSFKTAFNIRKTATIALADEKYSGISQDLHFLRNFVTSLVIGLTGGLICGFFLSFLFYPQIYTYIAFIQTSNLILNKKLQRINHMGSTS